MKEHISAAFKSQFGAAPDVVVRAPGRVNLIGEHTDYNLGFALPMAIDRAVWIALRQREDRRVWLRSLDFNAPADFALDEFSHAAGWTDYVRGMTWALSESGYSLSGWEGVLASEVPVGSGLSSSAAVELAVAKAFWAVRPWTWDGVAMAKVARRHENEWMGVKSGIMDQMISAIGLAGKAFLIDFRKLSFKPVPLPEGTVVVVMDTKVKRGLVESAYNRRVAECREAAVYFMVESLREVSVDIFEELADGLDDVIMRRARHVVTENGRVLSSAEKMAEGDAPGVGALMLESHASLREDYEVSCRELDLMVALATAEPGCFGARMTGAGFGGCAIALVEEGAAQALCVRVAEGYERETKIKPELYVCRPANGAEVVT